jgi:hypothetical protein
VSFFFKKVYVTRKTSSRQTTLRLHVERTQNKLDSSGIAREHKEAFEFNHEMLGGLSMRDP